MSNSPSLQIARFPDGGFVLHKITIPGLSGRFSAWYDAKGGLLDCEQIRANGNFPVKGATRNELATYGARHAARPV